jgi:hypothetical protein
MDYNVEEYTIADNLKRLDLELPNQLSFLPENIDSAAKKDDFIFTDSMIEVNKYFKAHNLEIDIFGGDSELYRSRNNADIYLPAIFISLSVITENPHLISVSLNILSNYIYDSLKGAIGKKTAHVEFHIESKEKGKVKKIDYKGDAGGLKDLGKIIKAMK